MASPEPLVTTAERPSVLKTKKRTRRTPAPEPVFIYQPQTSEERENGLLEAIKGDILHHLNGEDTIYPGAQMLVAESLQAKVLGVMQELGKTYTLDEVPNNETMTKITHYVLEGRKNVTNIVRAVIGEVTEDAAGEQGIGVLLFREQLSE